MNDGTDVPDRPPDGGLVNLLRVPRHAAVGVAVGVALAATVYLVRVFELLGPFRGARRYPVVGAEAWYLLLAVVLATTTALLVTTLLTLRTAHRLARRGPDDDGR